MRATIKMKLGATFGVLILALIAVVMTMLIAEEAIVRLYRKLN